MSLNQYYLFGQGSIQNVAINITSEKEAIDKTNMLINKYQVKMKLVGTGWDRKARTKIEIKKIITA